MGYIVIIIWDTYKRVVFMVKKEAKRKVKRIMKEVNAMGLSEEGKEREIRIRVDQAIIDKLKEFKEELDEKSYNGVLRKVLGVGEKEPVVDKAVARLEENIARERQLIEKLNKLEKTQRRN